MEGPPRTRHPLTLPKGPHSPVSAVLDAPTTPTMTRREARRLRRDLRRAFKDLNLASVAVLHEPSPTYVPPTMALDRLPTRKGGRRDFAELVAAVSDVPADLLAGAGTYANAQAEQAEDLTALTNRIASSTLTDVLNRLGITGAAYYATDPRPAPPQQAEAEEAKGYVPNPLDALFEDCTATTPEPTAVHDADDRDLPTWAPLPTPDTTTDPRLAAVAAAIRACTPITLTDMPVGMLDMDHVTWTTAMSPAEAYAAAGAALRALDALERGDDDLLPDADPEDDDTTPEPEPAAADAAPKAIYVSGADILHAYLSGVASGIATAAEADHMGQPPASRTAMVQSRLDVVLDQTCALAATRRWLLANRGPWDLDNPGSTMKLVTEARDWWADAHPDACPCGGAY